MRPSCFRGSWRTPGTRAARKLADEIVVLDKSGIAEQGTHDELIARDGWYAEMARLQAVGTEPEAAPGSTLVRMARVG